MCVVFRRRPGEGALDFVFQSRDREWTRAIQILQDAPSFDGAPDLAVGRSLEFNVPPHHVTQAVLEMLCAEMPRRHAISEHFLQACRAVTDPAKNEVVQTKELKGDIPPHGLTMLDHRDGKFHHVLPDAQCDVATSRVAMCKVPVLVCEHRAKRPPSEAVYQSDSQYQDPATPTLHAFADSPPLIDGHLGAWCDTDLVERTCANDTSHIPGQLPESGRLCGVETSARIHRLHADEEGLHHLVRGDHGTDTQNEHELHGNLAEHEEHVDHTRGPADDQQQDDW